MFKETVLRKLKVLGVIAVAALIIIIARTINSRATTVSSIGNVNYANSGHIKVTNDQLTKIEGTGLQKVVENENLALSVDFTDGNVEVLDKRSNYIWRSKPTEAELKKDDSTDLWKANLQSALMIEYVKDLTDATTNFANSQTSELTVSVLKMDGGTRVYFDYCTLGLRMALDYYLHDNYLEVDVPNYMIYETPFKYTTDDRGVKVPDGSETNNLITSYSILPFFGAGQSFNNAEGYMMVPDGPGAIIRYNQSRKYSVGFAGSIYGPDFSYVSGLDKSLIIEINKSRIFYPVFGMNRGKNSLLTILSKGESTAEVVANPSGFKTSFNCIYPHFLFRKRYNKIEDIQGNGKIQYTDKSVNLSRNIRYYFLNGDKSNYVGMGEAYRNYLIETTDLKKMKKPKGDMPMELTLFGGDEEDGLITPKFIPMTTFKQAGDIVEYFRQNKIDNMNIVYDSWQKRGASAKVPDRFPPDKHLGGAAELTKFIERVHTFGYKVFLADWHLDVTNTHGLSTSNDLVYDIQNAPLNWNYKDWRHPWYILNPSASDRILTRDIKEYKKFKADGLLEYAFNWVFSDFNKKQTMNREQFKDKLAQMAQKMKKEMGDLMLWRGMAYSLSDGVTVVNVAADYSNSPIIDEVIPFYQIALHGLLYYISVPYNEMDVPAQDMLKAVEYGSNISYLLTAEPAENLKYANSYYLNSSEFGKLKDDVIQIYKKVNNALGDVRDQYITNHEKIAPNVYRTTYENGKEVICNYSDSSYLYKKKNIPSMDFDAFEGE
jgi:hypothetical protein